MKNNRFATRAIHEGETPKLGADSSGDVVSPIHLSTTFARKDLEIPTGGYEYSRSGNPTRGALEKKLASLENATYGLAFASGLAAETTVLFSLLNPGDEVVGSDDLYGGTRRLFNAFSKFGIKASYANFDHGPDFEITKNTKMVWIESPTNPLLKLADIWAVKEYVGKDILVVVDNTFLSPYFQKPLDFGADVVIHSVTKYIGGHSDVVGGAIMTNNKELHEKLKFHQNALGAIASPFDSYMTMRGIKTLSIRMEKHGANAMTIANFLNDHSKVEAVFYPGLKSHPQHELAKKQMSGFGGIITFKVKGGYSETKRFLETLKIFALAESLGGVESLIEHPASMTHASIAKEDREKIGISDNLIRMSVGIEDVDDLMEDLENGLNKI
jgi:cystathionine gamma-lyase